MPENYICPICHKLPLGCTCWILGGSQKPGTITGPEGNTDFEPSEFHVPETVRELFLEGTRVCDKLAEDTPGTFRANIPSHQSGKTHKACCEDLWSEDVKREVQESIVSKDEIKLSWDPAEHAAEVKRLYDLHNTPIKGTDPNKEDLGKYMAGVLADFAPALQEVAKLGSMNNKPGGKYERGSWMLVQDPLVKYNDAFWRHLLDGPQNLDPTTGMHHDVAVAWNALALVWFRLQKEKDNANSNV